MRIKAKRTPLHQRVKVDRKVRKVLLKAKERRVKYMKQVMGNDKKVIHRAKTRKEIRLIRLSKEEISIKHGIGD